MLTTDTSAQKCIFRGGLIDGERARLDGGMSSSWDKYREEINDFLMDCIEIPREELWRYEGVF